MKHTTSTVYLDVAEIFCKKSITFSSAGLLHARLHSLLLHIFGLTCIYDPENYKVVVYLSVSILQRKIAQWVDMVSCYGDIFFAILLVVQKSIKSHMKARDLPVSRVIKQFVIFSLTTITLDNLCSHSNSLLT